MTDTITELFKAVMIGIAVWFSIGWFLIFMCWPVNDDQQQASAWVIFRWIKNIFK